MLTTEDSAIFARLVAPMTEREYQRSDWRDADYMESILGTREALYRATGRTHVPPTDIIVLGRTVVLGEE